MMGVCVSRGRSRPLKVVLGLGIIVGPGYEVGEVILTATGRIRMALPKIGLGVLCGPQSRRANSRKVLRLGASGSSCSA